MIKAKLIKVAGQLLIHTPYNACLVEEIRDIPGRRYDASLRAWSVPSGSEQQAREIVRKYFVIEGETGYDPYETITAKVVGRYPCSVEVDGIEVFSSRSGLLDMRPNGAYEIISYTGGLTYAERHTRYSDFGVDYTLTLKVRKGAKWTTTGNGDFEIVEEPSLEAFALGDDLNSLLKDL